MGGGMRMDPVSSWQQFAFTVKLMAKRATEGLTEDEATVLQALTSREQTESTKKD